jgi:hypothetical protein
VEHDKIKIKMIIYYTIYIICIFHTKLKKMELDLEDLFILRRRLELKSNDIVTKKNYNNIRESLDFRITLVKIVMCDNYQYPSTLDNKYIFLQLCDIYKHIYNTTPLNNCKLFDILVAIESKLGIII